MRALLSEFAVWLSYVGSPFFMYPWKPLLYAIAGAKYDRAYRHFSNNHNTPVNLLCHCAGLVHTLLASRMAASHPPPTSVQPYASVSKSDGEASEADMLVTKTTPEHLRKSKW